MTRKPIGAEADPVRVENKGLTVLDPNGAPIIFFDGATNFGNAGGVVNITLAVNRHLSAGDGIAHDIIAVAFLRCSVQVAKDLREAIDKALLIGVKPEGDIQ